MNASIEKLEVTSRNEINGSYSASLIGTIRSHLEGLQGYDVMALELIQNADDAKAAEIIFDVTNEGLKVWNSGEFTYCGSLGNKPCPNENYACDYHRITEVASGGKLSKSSNIGRFGIGFISTYQITDHPQIISSGIQLTLLPELQEWELKPQSDTVGTTFFLPWAKDPENKARMELGASAITSDRIDLLVEDFSSVLQKALLFLRHLKKAELRRNGEIIIICELDRDDDSELIISFKPEGRIERWLILRADAAEQATQLKNEFPLLETLDRSTNVALAIRVEPESLANGNLYAYLPTEQLSGLPIHINADFFPESDRKAVIFSGKGHQQAWNELLIKTAAIELAKDLEGLLDKLGYQQLWAMLSRSLVITQDRDQHYPHCFDQFWDQFKAAVKQGIHIVLTSENVYEAPASVLYPRQPLSPDKLAVLSELGGKILNEDLRPHLNVLRAFGSLELTFERFVKLLNAVQETSGSENSSQVTIDRFNTFFLPFWSIAEELIPENPSQQQVVNKFKSLPLISDTGLNIKSIDDCYSVPSILKAAEVSKSFPFLPFAHDEISKFPKLLLLIDEFDIDKATAELESRLIDDEQTAKEILKTSPSELKIFYSLLAKLDELCEETNSYTYERLQKLPIWKTGDGSFVEASHVLIPGNFEDPTGQSELLDPKLLEPETRKFLEQKLDVKEQTITEFIHKVVPRFIGANGPDDEQAYKRLLTTLANQPVLLDQDDVRKTLSELPLIPTQNEAWARPGQTYFRTDDLAYILGEAKWLWIDQLRLPNARSVHSFIKALGVRDSPSPEHLAERMIEIAQESKPTENGRKASAEAFYKLCEIYDLRKDDPDIAEAINQLITAECFPADGDFTNWYSPDEVYAPIRYQAFQSQANILDFKNLQRLSNKLLEALKIPLEPATQLIVGHLLHCIEEEQSPHTLTYQILNERAVKEDSEIEQLRDMACIYADSLQKYLRPNQLYLTPQHLGKYAFSIPEKFDSYKVLFKKLGVKDTPEPSDYVDILIDIANETVQNVSEDSDRKIHKICMGHLSEAWKDSDSRNEEDIEKLQDNPTILNVQNWLCFPDEVLLADSEWYRSFFNDELDPMLCKPDPELWPFFEELGVSRLSQVAQIELEFVDGIKQAEDEIARSLNDRVEILLRMLHDKSSFIQKKLISAIEQITVRSHDEVRIQAYVEISEKMTVAEPKKTGAFYDAENHDLVLARPVNASSWGYIFNALLHQLMPEEPSSEISRLGLALRPLMNMELNKAHKYLSESEVPELQEETESSDDIDLISNDLGELGVEDEETINSGAEPEDSEEDNEHSSDSDNSQTDTPSRSNNNSAAPGSHNPGKNDPSAGLTNNGNTNTPDANKTPSTSSPGSSTGYTGSTQNKRPAHKKSWDRKLISYVRPRGTGEKPEGKAENLSDAAYKLGIEAASRDLVCQYEKDRGREAEEMPQTHPGYDIISRNLATGEKRYIEVKGTADEWKERGVSLSKMQFSNAQDFGDEYWLYVVELALEEELARVHTIQNPAMQVDSYLFDGEWRHIAIEEAADPTLAFVSGAYVDCESFGKGIICEVQKHEQMRLLTIDFDRRGRRQLKLDLKSMKIIDAPNDNNNF